MMYLFDYYASHGGFINGAIFCVAVSILYIGTGKLMQYRNIRKLSIKITADSNDGTCDRFIYETINSKEMCSSQYFKNMFRERLLLAIPQLESGLDTMATLIQIAPFLGLLGTVAGMIQTFSLITKNGTANPVVLTDGITVSLLTTQAGLIVAFPCLLFHNYLCGVKDTLVKELISQGERAVKQLSDETGS